MSTPIIQVSNLSKSYTITHEGKERYTALRDVMAQKVKKYFHARHCGGRRVEGSARAEKKLIS